MMSKTNKFIIKPRIHKDFVYHDMNRATREIGLGYRYIDSSLLPEADICVGVQEIKQVPHDFKPFVEPHKHDANQFYIIIGRLTVEVTLDGERHEVDGPASIFIPAGVKHTFHPLRGSGYLVVVLRSGEYK